ncbi:two pore domain potassium channel family protein [Ornithinibacillus massiliensis]|uniref:Two pore domain potassium channel family protein n=2 Tax=Ornithinibacillus massiliensis TaxID=1944633 RepID=A0ABS5MEE7_9BACI|nr:potassium channel family protein [Ornithinibacillus massiliensis]MBS3680712.1 two pore domain potassium channel family protein [Ornithinibacillus massiliensis]
MISFILTAKRLLDALWKSFKNPVFQSLFVTLVLIVLSGTLFYSKVEGWAMIDAIYFAVVSLIPTGVETGLRPVTELGKIFTMMYLIVRVGIMIGLIGVIAKAVIRFEAKEKIGRGNR